MLKFELAYAAAMVACLAVYGYFNFVAVETGNVPMLLWDSVLGVLMGSVGIVVALKKSELKDYEL